MTEEDTRAIRKKRRLCKRAKYEQQEMAKYLLGSGKRCNKMRTCEEEFQKEARQRKIMETADHFTPLCKESQKSPTTAGPLKERQNVTVRGE